MPQPQGAALEELRARRERLRERYLGPAAARPATTAAGVHHVALICRDVEETIRFYQEFLGFPLVELVENRDYPGSSHFFFDIGNRNLLGFFDFPGHDHLPFTETIGGVQHIAISISAEQFATARQRRWILLEIFGCAAMAAAALVSDVGFFRYHILAMAVGQCLTSFFAVWTVHHDCEADGIFARTIRGGLKGWLTYDMFYHLEHHLFPAVPTSRLPELARRLDEADPEWSVKRVF